MAQFEPHKEEIQRNGSLLYIAAQKRGNAFANPEKFLTENPISFPFLLDEDRSVTKSYGVYKALSYDSINIARPATFVLDRECRVKYLYVGSNQKDRAPIDRVIEIFSHGTDIGVAHQT
jgi:peroxiredoxin